MLWSFQGHHVCRHVVNVFVGDRLQKFAMGRERIMNFNFGYVAVTTEPLRAIRFIREAHIEVADGDEIPFDLLAAG